MYTSFCKTLPDHVQADQHDLLGLLTWFRDGTDADAAAELVFSAHLSKKQRAHIHSCAPSLSRPSFFSKTFP